MRGPAAHVPTLRALYREKWGRDWPHDDEYLRELTREARSREEVVVLMRECHEFEPEHRQEDDR